ncbi:MAG: bifunctional DNA-formamidopyrimidine glycosylase/DNA-(apurinic or apyrimidinic site) lyase [Candidatus Uhrbacteria bacterium]
MPELPEVQTVVTQLNRSLHNRRIIKLIDWDTAKLFRPSPAVVGHAIRNARIRRVWRRAKLILIELDNGATLVVHLKLTGRLLIRREGDPPDVYTHARIALDHGLELRFADIRKFGYIQLIRSPVKLVQILKKYGPEPLASTFTPEQLSAIVRKRTTKIKPLLLDQATISGIGNIYSDEALFLAHIDPRRAARTLTDAEVKRLHRAIRIVLRAGISHHGTSDQWYVDAHGKSGTHQCYLRIYGRSKKPCRRCGAPIKRVRLGGRSAHFCQKCQH